MSRIERGDRLPSKIVTCRETPHTAIESRIPIPTLGERGTPIVAVDMNGRVVEAINVICSCGQQIRLECDYASHAHGQVSQG